MDDRHKSDHATPDDTRHLLASPRNAERLKRALAQARRTGSAADVVNAEREAACLGLSLNAATIIFGDGEGTTMEENRHQSAMDHLRSTSPAARWAATLAVAARPLIAEEMDETTDAVGHFTDFCRAVSQARGQRLAEHHDGMIYALADFHAGGDNLMILAPPGCGKTTYVGELFPAWLLRKKAGMKIILAASSQKMAEHQAQRVQKLSGGKIDGRFLKTDDGGELMAVGQGSALAGFRADYIVIDYCPGSKEAAEPARMREWLWNWFLAGLTCRRKPSGRTVLVASRWHEDDLAGRIMQAEADHWRVVEMPAHENGRWLWDDDPDYPYGKLLREVAAEYQRTGNLRDWNALYQQRPEPEAKVRGWDVASTDPAVDTEIRRLESEGRRTLIGAAKQDTTTAGLLLTVAADLEAATARLKEALARMEREHSAGSAIDREQMAAWTKRVN